MTAAKHTPNLEAGATGSTAKGRLLWVARASEMLAHVAAVPAALLVLAEIAILSAGITARYVFHAPIVWSDELAGILFLWLAMLGSVIAFQRGEHMRMTAIVSMLGPAARAFLDVVAVATSLAFLLLVIHPAYDFAIDEVYVTTPALGIVNSWRAAALPAGLGLMLVVAVVRLASISSGATCWLPSASSQPSSSCLHCWRRC
jgi:TRAP-type C4-dicarboxylate transport system permease small subunit